MMRTSLSATPLTKPLAWLFTGLLLVLPIGQHAMAGVLVCIGADGHVDVENGRSGDCSDRFALGDDLHDGPAETKDPATDDCGDCLDVPFLVNPAEGRVALTKAPSPASQLAVPAAPLLVAPVAAREQVPTSSPPPALPPGLAALRTVVLLT